MHTIAIIMTCHLKVGTCKCVSLYNEFNLQPKSICVDNSEIHLLIVYINVFALAHPEMCKGPRVGDGKRHFMKPNPVGAHMFVQYF